MRRGVTRIKNFPLVGPIRDQIWTPMGPLRGINRGVEVWVRSPGGPIL